MKRAQVLKEVQAAWWALERVAGHTDLLGKCEAESLRVEKEHRAMGRRFTNGANHYTMSAEWAARYFVVKHVCEHMPIPQTWAAFEGYRVDVAMSQALREQLQKHRDASVRVSYNSMRRNLTEAFKAIDYAGDIALPC
jgi:hypothetical protein